jgi:hypothetical protein
MRRFSEIRKRNPAHLFLILIVLSILTVLPQVYSGADAAAQQEAEQSRKQLESRIKHAQDSGIPNKYLETILQQEETLKKTHPPFAFVGMNVQAVNHYHANLKAQYQFLSIQTQGLVAVATQQLQSQAAKSLAEWQQMIGKRRTDGLPVEAFSTLYRQTQERQKKASLPADYTAIIQVGKQSIKALTVLPNTYEKLIAFQGIIDLAAESQTNVAPFQQYYKSDKQAITQATTPTALEKVNLSIDTHSQQLISRFTQVLPTLTQNKIKELTASIARLKSNKVQVNRYERELAQIKVLQQQTRTTEDYKLFKSKASTLQNAMKFDLLVIDAQKLIKKYYQEVEKYKKEQIYQNPYDGQSYALNFGYFKHGLGEDLENMVKQAQTYDELQAAYTAIDNSIFLQQMSDIAYHARLPYNSRHQSDIKLMQHFKVMDRQVVLVSFTEQALRIYNNGKLVNSWLIISGRPELPAVPGFWRPLHRVQDVQFKSPWPKESPHWYPDTPINYGILYREGGYFLHDSPWRTQYGPGTQFPHADPGGSTGSHGCINMPLEYMQWLYNNTTWNTIFILY